MPRPKKCRRICALPRSSSFGPLEGETAGVVELAQAECAAQMEVARSTAQAVYDAARTKLARALVEGRRLVIAGGDYALCPHAAGCAGRDCVRRGCGRRCGCGGCSQHKNGGK